MTVHNMADQSLNVCSNMNCLHNCFGHLNKEHLRRATRISVMSSHLTRALTYHLLEVVFGQLQEKQKISSTCDMVINTCMHVSMHVPPLYYLCTYAHVATHTQTHYYIHAHADRYRCFISNPTSYIWYLWNASRAIPTGRGNISKKASAVLTISKVNTITT